MDEGSARVGAEYLNMSKQIKDIQPKAEWQIIY
jgi:hypothetical protein